MTTRTGYIVPTAPGGRVTANEKLWRHIVQRELTMRGYTEDEIAAFENHECDPEVCDLDPVAPDHTDEFGRSNHPEYDEWVDVVGVIGRALEEAQRLAEKEAP